MGEPLLRVNLELTYKSILQVYIYNYISKKYLELTSSYFKYTLSNVKDEIIYVCC